MEIWAWKSMLGLPKTAPTAAVIFSTDSLFASIRVQIKQLIYLHTVFRKQDDHWTITTLRTLVRHNAGWARQIQQNLTDWGLESNFEIIKNKTPNQWKKSVYEAAEKKNKEMLLNECYKRERGNSILKTKTQKIIPILENEEYIRKPQPFMKKNKTTARAYIMGRFGMLQCAANFSHGFGGKNCKKCKVVDNESHRINNCVEWEGINLLKSNEILDYNLIYSEDENESTKVVQQILSMWDLGNNRNCMRST